MQKTISSKLTCFVLLHWVYDGYLVLRTGKCVIQNLIYLQFKTLSHSNKNLQLTSSFSETFMGKHICSPWAITTQHKRDITYKSKAGYLCMNVPFLIIGIPRTESKTVFFYVHTFYFISSVSDVYKRQWMRSIHPKYAPPTGLSSVWEDWSAISERGEYILI